MDYASPTPLDSYSRFMTEVFDEKTVISVPTGFQAFFGRPEAGGSKTIFNPDSEVVDIDIIRGNEKMAKMILRGTNGRPLNKQENVNVQKFTNINRVYPLIEEEGDINASQLNKRVAGENPYANMSRFDRARYHVLTIHQETVRRIVRTFEYLASSSVLTGSHPAILGTADTDLIYDFLRKSTHTFATAAAWDGGSQDIMGDIDTGCRLIRVDAFMNPDMMVLGESAMKAFLADDDVKEKADNRRYELIRVNRDTPVPPRFNRFINAGFLARGMLRTPAGYELWMFTYTDVYTDDAGDPQNYMPVDQCLIACSTARCDRNFGPPEQLPMDTERRQLLMDYFGFTDATIPTPANIKDAGAALDPMWFYFDVYKGAAQKTLTVRTQTAPIFPTTQTDAFVTITDLIT